MNTNCYEKLKDTERRTVVPIRGVLFLAAHADALHVPGELMMRREVKHTAGLGLEHAKHI